MDSAEMAALATRAIAISEKVADTQGDIVTQQGKSKRTLRWVLAGLALDLILSVSMVTLAADQAHVSAQIHQSQLNACAIGNDFRARQVALWDHVIAVSQAPPGETASERTARLAKLAAFRVYVRAQFMPVDCAKLYGK